VSEIVDTYIQQDIAGFLRVENIRAFNHLIRILASQIGNLVNKSELNATLGISINTLSKYLDMLEGTYVVDLLSPYFTNIRKELSKMPKVYFHDLGLRNYLLYGSVGTLPIQDIGELVENDIHNVLRYHQESQSLHFYRTSTKQEIDYILRRGALLIPIEVKYRTKIPRLDILDTFAQDYAPSVSMSIVVTRDICRVDGDRYSIPACMMGLIQI
jgi:uncharacterized protein